MDFRRKLVGWIKMLSVNITDPFPMDLVVDAYNPCLTFLTTLPTPFLPHYRRTFHTYFYRSNTFSDGVPSNTFCRRFIDKPRHSRIINGHVPTDLFTFHDSWFRQYFIVVWSFVKYEKLKKIKCFLHKNAEKTNVWYKYAKHIIT